MKTKVDPLKKLFPFGKDSDERYIRSQMHKWLLNTGGERPGFKRMLMKTLHTLNGGGKTLKYLHFSEKAQKVYLSNQFLAWAEQVIDEMKIALMPEKYIVELVPETWLCFDGVEPARTFERSYAKIFPSKKAAEQALKKARKIYSYPDAKIYQK